MDEPQTTAPGPEPKNHDWLLVGILVLAVILGVCGALASGLLTKVSSKQNSRASSSASSTSIIPTSTVTASSTPSDPPGASATSSDPVVAAATSSYPTVVHVPLPDEVRGMYWTAWTAGSKRADSLLAYASSSHLNTVVMDLKLDGGELGFVPRDPGLQEYAPKSPVIGDLDALLGRLKDRGVYRIARIAVMRDGAFGRLHPETALRASGGGVWRDKTGVAWLDPAAPEVADYALALAHEAYARGFDEIQFDYVRFASDGKLSAIRYPVYDGKLPKSEVMRKFFERVGGQLQSENIPVSFDLFGLTCCALDDLGIGQRLSDVMPYSDHVSQMAYPSHYANGFEGFANPALFPYEVVKDTLDKSLVTLHTPTSTQAVAAVQKKLRPWIQDFDLGAVYDASKVEAQIKAARDANASGWMLWNARNVYTPADYVK